MSTPALLEKGSSLYGAMAMGSGDKRLTGESVILEELRVVEKTDKKVCLFIIPFSPLYICVSLNTKCVIVDGFGCKENTALRAGKCCCSRPPPLIVLSLFTTMTLKT